MKNYLEKRIGDEDQLSDKQLDAKLSSDKQLNKQLDQVANKLKESNDSYQQPEITMEELDQDKFNTVKLSKRNLKNSQSKELNAVRKVKMFYRSCMNETTVNDEATSANVILNLIYEYGGEWSLLSKHSYSNKTFKQIHSIQNPTYRFDTKRPIKNKLETRMFSLFLHQINPIFHFYVAPEEFKRNSKEYAIHVSIFQILFSNQL